MKIQILQLISGAREARGLTVIIDVFRAFSLACYLFDRGVKKIIPTGDLQLAYNLKRENPEYLLAGERNEKTPAGFDFGNSPTLIPEANLHGKTVVHTSSAGTQGIVNAVNASEIITGSFVNAGAIVKYIRMKKPAALSLVCMGYSALYPIEEDTYCAELIQNELEGRETDFGTIVRILREGSGKRFFEPDKQHFAPSSDFYLCTDLNRFDFVIRADRDEKQIALYRYNFK
jgi:2-phosphosulfolactate phosphatase